MRIYCASCYQYTVAVGKGLAATCPGGSRGRETARRCLRRGVHPKGGKEVSLGRSWPLQKGLPTWWASALRHSERMATQPEGKLMANTPAPAAKAAGRTSQHAQRMRACKAGPAWPAGAAANSSSWSGAWLWIDLGRVWTTYRSFSRRSPDVQAEPSHERFLN